MKRTIDLVKNTFSQWSSREAPRMGASLAFYSILSLAPLVILVVSVCALAFGASGAQAQILEQFRQMVGENGAKVIEGVLKSAQKPATGILASVVGIGTLLFGASGVFIELRAALDKLWDVQAESPASGLWSYIRDRFLSFGMVLGIAFLLLVSLAISAGLGTAGKFFASVGILPPAVWEVVNFLVSLTVVSGLFAMIMRYVPNTHLPWPFIARGAVLTALLFTAGKTLIGIYLGKAGVGSAYGAAGSLVVLVVWIYYSSQIFFFGAMFTRVYAEVHGWKPKPVEKPTEVKSMATPAPFSVTPQPKQTAAGTPSLSAKFAAAGLLLAGLIGKHKRRA